MKVGFFIHEMLNIQEPTNRKSLSYLSYSMKKRTLYFLVPYFISISCTTTSYDDIQEVIDEDPIETVTFQEVAFIIQNNCLACHSNPPQNGAPMPLTSYFEVKSAVENFGLINRISRNNGESGLMPLGGPRLPQQQIDLIVQWNTDGLLEN